MNRVPAWRRMLGPALASAAILAALAACSPVDKVDGLVRRARSEMISLRPHPDFVPTPLAEPSRQASVPATSASATKMPGPPAAASPEAGSNGGTNRLASVPNLATPPATYTQAPAAPAPSAAALQPESPLATPAPTATEAPAATATPAYRAAEPSVALEGVKLYWQGWNNCGPATLAMNLSYFGSNLSQEDIAAVLRPDRDDKNVNPDEMAGYARSQGFQALVRANGDADRLRLLVSNGVPVLVETWMEPKPNDGMGHYRLLTGYDDATRQWIVYDSYESTGVDPKQPYRGIRIGYDELDRLWRVFDRTYIVIYTDKEAPAVAGIIGGDMDETAMWQRAAGVERAAVDAGQADAFDLFNLGTDLVALGRYSEAASAYDQARHLGLPWRMLWYQFGPFRAYLEVGRYREVVALADATLATTDNIEELHYWRGMALRAQGDLAGARQAWQRALHFNRNYRAPAEALSALGQ